MNDELEIRALSYAKKLAALANLVHEREGADCVAVPTDELCRALGKAEGAHIDEVRQFSLAVQRHLGPLGMTAACGCAHLALQVMARDAMDRAVEEARDLKVFNPESIEEYREKSRP